RVVEVDFEECGTVVGELGEVTTSHRHQAVHRCDVHFMAATCNNKDGGFNLTDSLSILIYNIQRCNITTQLVPVSGSGK
ncbi:unnamed protein product, partial [Mycena citricolor]